MDGNHYTITDDEYQKAIIGDGLLVFRSCGITINKSRIESIYPESMADQVEDKKLQQTGRLHDGTLVKRHFGEWVDAYSAITDDDGKSQPVRLDRNYYPEVAMDAVMTDNEYAKVKHLPREEIRDLLVSPTDCKRLNQRTGLLGEIRSNKKAHIVSYPFSPR